MRYILLLTLLTFVGCCPKVAPVSEKRDSVVVEKIVERKVPVVDSVRTSAYLDSLLDYINSLPPDTVLKEVVKVRNNGVSASLLYDAKRKAIVLQAKLDSVIIARDSVKTVTVTTERVQTIERCTSWWHELYKKFTWAVIIIICLYIIYKSHKFKIPFN